MTESYRPETLEEALALMHKKRLIPIAGATDLFIRSRNWQGASRAMKGDTVFIGHLPELRHLIDDEGYYRIGAAVTQAEMANCSFLPEYARVVVSQMGNPAIRNAATIGGNLANAARVADLLPLFYCLDAKVVLASFENIRIMPIDAFETGKYATAIEPHELIVEILVPKVTVKRYMYVKTGARKASILSKVSFLGLETDHSVQMAIGAVNDTVIRSKELEAQFYEGRDMSQALVGYKRLLNSSDDTRSTKQYREKVAMNLLEKWLEGCL